MLKLHPPVSFGSYSLLRKIGEGGEGEVFLATPLKPSEENGGNLALKIMWPLPEPRQSHRNEHVLNFLNEALVLSYLDHPNIVRFVDFGEHHGRLYLGLEYIEGSTLQQIIEHHQKRQKRMPLDLVLQLMIEICKGLDYAYQVCADFCSLGVVHSDLTPKNILISRRGELKLIDFTQARINGEFVKPIWRGIKGGSISFMPPEQASGGTLDNRSDLFSVGLLLYCCLTLKTLYTLENWEAEIYHGQEEYIKRRLEGLPPMPARKEILELLNVALSFDPKARFQSADEMAATMRDILNVLPQHTPLTTWLATIWGKPNNAVMKCKLHGVK
jgi:serine/threonine protein kinase